MKKWCNQDKIFTKSTSWRENGGKKLNRYLHSKLAPWGHVRYGRKEAVMLGATLATWTSGSEERGCVGSGKLVSGKDHCKNGVRGKNGKLCLMWRCTWSHDQWLPSTCQALSKIFVLSLDILNLISVSVRTWWPVLKIKVTVVKKHQTFKGLSFYLPIQTSDWNEMPDVANISFEDKILLDDIDQRRSRSSVLVSRGGQTRNIFTRHMAAAATSGNTAVTPPTVHPPSLEQFLDMSTWEMKYLVWKFYSKSIEDL